jgi:hypothetical protein
MKGSETYSLVAFSTCGSGFNRRTVYNPSESQHISSALKVETARFSETLASTNQSTRHIDPKEHHQNHAVRWLVVWF